jgi:serine protease Do
MLRRLLTSIVLVGAGVAIGAVMTARTRTAANPRSEEIALPAATPETPRPTPPSESTHTPPETQPPVVSGLGAPDFTRIAGVAVKGVANISSLQVVRTPNSPFTNDPFFRYFFGDDQFFGARDRRSLSLGSGVMISADGYIVTNNHVVGENVREITVALGDKREVRGKVIGTDAATDIALLKINVSGASVVPWGDSSKLKVGEWVLAIGSPFQLSQTVTAGIISATGRTNVGLADYEDFVQTDAAINPGNSGGALINTRGELVGINTGIFSESGGYQGIGFAVPSNLAFKVVTDLMKYGEVRRGSIGYLRVEKLTEEYAQEYGAPNTNGAIIARMVKDSEAYNAGLRPGDVIVEFNKQKVDDPSQFFRLVADAKVGSTATMRVLRGGRPMDVKLAVVSSSTAVASAPGGRSRR